MFAGASGACGREATTPILNDAAPATITRSTTDTVRLYVAEPVGELNVIVKNAEGQPIDTASVTFAVMTGGGSLTASNTRTDSLGRASTAWTLGTRAGVQTMTATVGTLGPAVFVAVAMPDGLFSLTTIAGDNQSAAVGTTVPTNPSVKATDMYGNPVPNWAVLFFPDNGGTVNDGVSGRVIVLTDTAGIARVTWRLGPNVGPDTLIVQPNMSTARVPFVAFGFAPTTSANEAGRERRSLHQF
jgi:hypothetical protein